MNVVLAGTTSGIGKTTLAVNLVHQRMPEARIISVETINEDATELGAEATQLAGGEFRKVFTALLEGQDTIVDVGASNVEAFLGGLARFHNAHLEVALFLIPSEPSAKGQKETVQMYLALTNLGVPTERIRIVLNRVNSDPEVEFDYLFRYALTDPGFPLDPRLAVMQNEVFDMLLLAKTSLASVIADPTDYRSKIRQLGDGSDPKGHRVAINRYQMQCLAFEMQRNLDEVWGFMTEGSHDRPA